MPGSYDTFGEAHYDSDSDSGSASDSDSGSGSSSDSEGAMGEMTFAEALAQKQKESQSPKAVALDDDDDAFSGAEFDSEAKLAELKALLDEDKDDQNIVRSTIEMAHHLGLTVIAEGVENHAALVLLKDMGCDAIQGYYLGRPMAVADLEVWLRAFKETTMESSYG